MRVSDEPNVDVLRQKARVLESENERLSEKVSELYRQLLEIKGLDTKTIDCNLPGLLAQVTGKPAPTTTPTSERRQTNRGERGEKKPRTGHGPTEQPALKIEKQSFKLDEADKTCAICGKVCKPWVGKDDVVHVVDRIPAQWIVRECTLEKCRCPDGCSIVTAEGPRKLISGGRYALGVALQSSLEKFIFHAPIERQVRMAALAGMRITSQTLWDQQWALAQLLQPLVGQIKHFILDRDWLGADLTPFQHVKKGGSVKQQVWQLACPQARYFEMLPSKAARIGRQVFEIKISANGVEVVKLFKGTAVVDGAAELEKLAADLGFDIANCWSHARRAVLKASSEAPGQVAEFLALVGRLYEIERAVAGVGVAASLGYRNKIDIEILRRARDEQSRPAVAAIEKWILEQRCIPGGKLKAGLEYVAARWTNLKKFLGDPAIPLDNNITEAGFIGLAQGRRNYIGCRTERGMQVATTFYTVFESARVCGADPNAYLQYAAEMLLDAREPMLPHTWLAAGSPCADTS